MLPLRGWQLLDAVASLALDVFKDRKTTRPILRGAAIVTQSSRPPARSGLGSENCFRTPTVIVFLEHCGDGSLGRGARFHCLRVDGWTFDTVAGKRFSDELNQTFHRGSWHRKLSWPDQTASPAFTFDESPRGDAWSSQAGGSHRLFHPFRRDGSPQRGDSEPPLTSYRPLFFRPGPYARGLKKCCVDA